jgi:hypothetical protein
MGKKRDEWDCHSPTVLVQKTLNSSQGMDCIYTLNPLQFAGLRDAVLERSGAVQRKLQTRAARLSFACGSVTFLRQDPKP